jgi:outer membrane biosynthesis protein TonB
VAAPPPPAPAAPTAASAPSYPPIGSWGEPDAAKLKKLFEKRFAEVKRCYEAELQRHPDARGKITLRFRVVESGALRDVEVAKSTFARKDVPACVAEVVGRWTTPFRPDEPVEVEYPLSFTPR